MYHNEEEVKKALAGLSFAMEFILKQSHALQELQPYQPSEFVERLLLSRRSENDVDLQFDNDENPSVFNFTEKEIKKMPRLKDCKIRMKRNSYEIRYRKHGYDKSFSAKTLEEAKRKAKQWLNLVSAELDSKEYFSVVKNEKNGYFTYRSLFSTFATDYMIKMKKPRIKPETWRSYWTNYNNYIIPKFGELRLHEITSFMLQEYLSELHVKVPRACEDVKVLLNNIFNFAVNSNVLTHNPLLPVYVPKHERTLGQALTLEEERQLVERIKGEPLELVFLVALYCGARPGELASITFNVEENSLTIKNGKLKNYQKDKFRTIPIFPKLQPYLARLTSENWQSLAIKSNLEKFRMYCPGHALKDLRHTFTTRAKECRINDEIVSVWTGHSLNSLTARVYTHFSLAFMQEEAKKLVY